MLPTGWARRCGADRPAEPCQLGVAGSQLANQRGSTGEARNSGRLSLRLRRDCRRGGCVGVIRPRCAALVVGMNDDQTELPELWVVDELAAYLGVTRHYVFRLTSEHRIRFVRVGKTVRFRRADVAAWMDAETVEAAGPEPAPARRGRPRDADRGAA